LLLGRLDLGNGTRAETQRQLAEIERIFPGANISTAVLTRVDARLRAETGHAEAERARAQMRAEDMALLRYAGLQVAQHGFLRAERAVLGDGIAGITDRATLGNAPGAGDTISFGMGNPWGRVDPDAHFGQRPGSLDSVGAFAAGGRPSELSEDGGNYMRIAELVDATDIARARVHASVLRGRAEALQRRATVDAGWAAPDHDPALLPERWQDPTSELRFRFTPEGGGAPYYVYSNYTDLTIGPGPSRMPNEAVLSAADRATMLADRSVVSGETFLEQNQTVTGNVLVYGSSPTGAWAAVAGQERQAIAGHTDTQHVDWAHSGGQPTGSRGSNEGAFDGTEGIDRTQNAFDNANIHRTTDPVLLMQPAEPGVNVTFQGARGPYVIHYAQVVIAIGQDISSTGNATQGAGAGPMIANLGPARPIMAPPDASGHRVAAGVETEGGRVRLLGSTAAFVPGAGAPGVTNAWQGERLRGSQAAQVAAAAPDHPTNQTVYIGTHNIATANQILQTPVALPAPVPATPPSPDSGPTPPNRRP
jgi:hypothetical protein